MESNELRIVLDRTSKIKLVSPDNSVSFDVTCVPAVLPDDQEELVVHLSSNYRIHFDGHGWWADPRSMGWAAAAAVSSIVALGLAMLMHG